MKKYLLEAIAKLRCVEKSMILRPVARAALADRSLRARTFSGEKASRKGRKWAQKGDFAGYWSFAIASIAFSLFSVGAFALPTLENKDGEFYFSNDGTSDKKTQGSKEGKPRKDVTSLFEVKGGYFFFSDSTMRDVYPGGGLDFQLAYSGRIWKWIQVYGSAEYIEVSGSSLNAHQKTKIQIIPLSLGLKPTFTIAKSLDYYLNIGPRYFFVHQHNKSHYVDTNVNENGLGGFVGTGFLLHLNDRLILDGYGELSYFSSRYSSFKTNVVGHSIDVGGFAFGGGLGYSF